MRRVFDELVKTEGVIGGLLVGRDGLVIQTLMIEEEDAEVLGALAANMYDTIAKTTQRLGIGSLSDTIIEAKNGTLLLCSAAEQVVIAICQQPVRLGEVRLALLKAARLVEKEFED
jgi:uncharacterized protein